MGSKNFVKLWYRYCSMKFEIRKIRYRYRSTKFEICKIRYQHRNMKFRVATSYDIKFEPKKCPSPVLCIHVAVDSGIRKGDSAIP